MSKQMLFTGGSVTLQAAKKGPPKVSILAYTGGLMYVPGFGRVVIDVAGMALPGQVPLPVDHNTALSGIVGHATPAVVAGKVIASGILSAATEAAKQVLALARDGLSWQASVGVEVTASRPVKAGETIHVNGVSISEKQPWTLVTESVLKEISIVALGADGETSVSIAAARSARRNNTMTFEQWLAAQGWDASTLTDQQTTTLRASYDAEMGNGNQAAAALREEASRLVAIRTTCRNHPDIEARAIDEGWSRDQTELAVLRASRSTPPTTLTSSRRPEATGDVLQASLLLHLGAHDVAEKAFDANTLQAASDLRIRHVMDVCEHALRAAHIEPRGSKTDILRAGWTAATLPNLLGSSADKIASTIYQALPSTALRVAKILSASNFREHVGIRLTSSRQTFEEVGGAGEIAHGNLEESTHTYKIATYAKMFSVTRQSIINDDLGLLNEIPRLIAIGAMQKLESIFWALVSANSGSFFSDGNNNALTTALGETGLGSAVALMRRLTNEEGEPLAVTPKYLVVPPELETTADGLFASNNVVIAGDTDTSRTSGNVFAGKYEPVVVPHLSNSNYTGYSLTRWFLLADPSTVAAFAVAFLDGRRTPTIETQDADFNTLGIQMRGYHDFGSAQVDSSGGIMSTGVGGE